MVAILLTIITAIHFNIGRRLLNKRKRFFVEAGALDGETISNTLYFEIKHNWTGLLIEPNPEYLLSLVRKKRNSWIFPHCLSPIRSPTVVDFDAMGEYGGIIYNGNGIKKRPGTINRNNTAEWSDPIWRRTIKVYLI